MKLENDTKQNNYIIGNDIYLLSNIYEDSMSELIGRVGANVSAMPYDIKNGPIIDIYINSPGGDVSYATSLMTQLARARTKGAKIRTTVLHRAASAASLLAVQGDQGMRIMYEYSYHFIHYGRSQNSVTDIASQETAYNINKINTANLQRIYQNNSFLTQDALNDMFTTETGYLTPDECLKYGLCDLILLSNGQLVSR